MPTQETNTTKFRFIEEAVIGTTPAAGFWNLLRVTAQGLKHKKDTVKSNEIQPSGNVVNLIQVGKGAEGDMQFEYTSQTFDQFIAGVLRSSFGLGTTYALSGINLDAATADDSYNRLAGSFVDEGFAVNQWVKVTGFATALNNGYHKVTAVAALKLTVAGINLTTEASGAGRTITGFNGTVAAEQDLDAAAGDNSFNRTVGSFITDGFKVGQWVMTYGFANNANAGPHKITALTATKMTCAGSVLFTEAAAASRAIIGHMVRNSTTKKSFSFEEEFPTATAFVVYKGMRPATWQLNVTAKQLITGSFSFMGFQGVSSGVTSVVSGNVSPNGFTPANAATNVGNILENGVSLTTAVRSFQMTVADNPREIPKIGSLTPDDINYGFCDVTGTIEAYFQNRDLYEKFLNHDTTSFAFRITDPEGNMTFVTIPKLKFNDGDPNVPGVNQDVMCNLPFTGIYDSVTDCTIQVDTLPAAA